MRLFLRLLRRGALGLGAGGPAQQQAGDQTAAEDGQRTDELTRPHPVGEGGVHLRPQLRGPRGDESFVQRTGRTGTEAGRQHRGEPGVEHRTEIATPRPPPNSFTVPWTPAPEPAFAGGIELMMALAMAGMARAIPQPINSRPAGIHPYP